MKSFCVFAVFPLFLFGAVSLAELPPELKHTADEFDRTMQGYDDASAAKQKLLREALLSQLTRDRKREELLKRLDAVAAIDAEIKAFKAGSLPEEAPAHLPVDVSHNRKFYLSTLERDTKHFEYARRKTRENYLGWLARMAEVARVGKNTELAAAVAREEQRVRAAEAAEQAEADPSSDRQDAQRSACCENVRKIGEVCLTYSTKNGDVYPNSLEDLVRSGELDEVPVSPFAEDQKSPSYELTMPGFPGASAGHARMIVVRCKVAGPDGNVSAGFADGQVEAVPADALPAAYSAARSTPRKWSDPTGTYSTQASFAEFVAGGVNLKKTDGTIISVPYAKLSKADLDFLRGLNAYAPR